MSQSLPDGARKATCDPDTEIVIGCGGSFRGKQQLTSCSGRQGFDRLNDIRRRVRSNFDLAVGADNPTDSCEQHPQTVQDVGDRGDGGSGIRPLVMHMVAANRDGGRDMCDAIGIGSVETFEVLSRRD